MLTDEAALATLELTTATVVLVGHSHVPLSISLADGELVSGGLARAGTRLDLDGDAAGCSTPGRSASRGTATRARPGSCSTRRGGLPLFRRVAYPIERTQSEMREAGLPEPLASRLGSGSMTERGCTWLN